MSEIQQRTEENDDAPGNSNMQGFALASLTFSLASIAFVLSLDNAILATAMPQITSDFNNFNDMGWYGSSYLMAQMAMLPTCGRFYTFFHIKWTFSIFVIIFEVGSIVCATALNSAVLIAGRAIAGLGAAGLISGSNIIISYCVALRKRPMILAIILGLYGVGQAVGPLVGGAITDNKTLTWRFIFWINLPLGGVGWIQFWFTLKNPPPAAKAELPWLQKIRQLDISGAVALLGATTCLNLALQWGGIVYPWSNSHVFGCMIGFSLLLLAFIYLQVNGKESATIPLHLFQSRSVCAACGFMMLMQVAIVVQTYYWPIYFQSVRNTSARDSGIFLLPMIISNSISTLVAGWISSKSGHYVPLMWIGAPILAVGGGLYQIVRADSPNGLWIGCQILSGVGYGICGQMPILSVQVVLSKADVPTGLSTIMFFQSLGGTLAPSIGQNLFTDKLLRYLKDVQGVDGQAVVKAGGREFRDIVPAELLDVVIDAFRWALRNVFWVAVATPALAWLVSWTMEWRKLTTDDGDKDSSTDDTTTEALATELPNTKALEK